MIVLNDPYSGGMHLPDLFMFRPIYFERALQGFAVVVIHHSDMGGRVPGSNASDSTEIFQEGLRIPPLKLYERDVPNRTLHRLIAQNVRLPETVLGDLNAQGAACRMGEHGYLRLLERYGADAMHRYQAALIDYAERLTRAEIGRWPDGTYRFEDHIDDDGFSDDPIPIRVAITVAGERLVVDFAGSSPQVRGAINSTLSFVKSATYLSVRCVLDRAVPNNSGMFRAIEVRAPEGSILNAAPPAPVAARALTGYRVVDAVLGCLAQIVPDRIPAAGEGGNTVVCIGGYDAARRAVRDGRHDQRRLGRAARQGRHRGDHQPFAEHVEHAGRGARGAAAGPDRGVWPRPRQLRCRPVPGRPRPGPELSPAGRRGRAAAAL